MCNVDLRANCGRNGTKPAADNREARFYLDASTCAIVGCRPHVRDIHLCQSTILWGFFADVVSVWMGVGVGVCWVSSLGGLDVGLGARIDWLRMGEWVLFRGKCSCYINVVVN